MSVRCGIDLGTTYSSIAWYDKENGSVVTVDLDTSDGGKLLRSVVYYPAEGRPAVVGDTAWNAARREPERVVSGIKRAMGREFKTPAIDGNEYSPQQVSAEILKVLARDAGTFLGEEVAEAVITVPAHFGDAERAATREAGELAGFKVLGLLPEPHAAALAFSVEKAAAIADRHLLVYDLGGGTFDVTLIRAARIAEPGAGPELEFETICKDGNAACGGLDWDRALAELVAKRVLEEHGVDLREDAKNEAALLDNCERAKRELSRVDRTAIVADAQAHEVEITRAEFEDATRHLLLQTQMLLEKVLEDAQAKGLKRDRIEVMLSGGSSRMPMVKEMIRRVMGREPFSYKNPDLLVTIGAAYWSHLSQGGKVGREDIRINPGTGLEDKSSYPIGIQVACTDEKGEVEQRVSVIVPQGAKAGERFPKEFATSAIGQTEIDIILFKGDAPLPAAENRIGQVLIAGLPPGRPKGQPVLVTLGYDGSLILFGDALDVKTGKKVEIRIDRGSGGS